MSSAGTSSKLNIDSFDPGYKLVPKKIAKKDRRVYYYVKTGYSHKSIGINPRKMLDWRNLERRYHELDTKWLAANKKLWDSFALVGREQGEDEEKWILAGDDVLYIVSPRGGGYSIESAYGAAMDLVRSPKASKRNYFVVREDEGGREIARLKSRCDRHLKASAMYKEAFKKAVFDRIRVHIETLVDMSNSAYYGAYYPQKIFIINDF
jgi:hypothetical protein